MKYTTIVSESRWYIDDGEADREIHDDMMMLYLFHVGAKWWCHFIVIQSVKKTSTWHDMHKKNKRKDTQFFLKKMLDLNLSWYCGCASRFTTNAVLEILIQKNRCIWEFRFRPMHLGVVVLKNRCAWGFRFTKIDALGGSCLEEFRFGKINALRGSSSKIDAIGGFGSEKLTHSPA